MRTGTQSIDRAAQLLVRVVESAHAPSVSELALATGLPKSTTSRLVGALERQGLVQRDGGRASVRPGPVLLRFVQRGLSEAHLIELAAGALDRLAEQTGETVNLTVPTALGIAGIAQRDSRHIIGSTNWVGRQLPDHCTAAGKVFLAYGVARLPAGELERLAPRTIVDRAELERELARVRARGYATIVDELEPGLWAVAVPVAGPAGVVAALSISGPTTRLRDGLLGELARLLAAEAATLSARLGTNDRKEGAA